MENPAHYEWQGEDLILRCRLQPKSARDEFSEILDGQIKIRITAPPVDGKANKHLIRFLAKQCRVPQERVTIMSGDTSKQKRIRIRAPQTLPEGLKLTSASHQSKD
ncbi:MAG: YggU family protein [Pseudomonadales bacterium]|nr:YggU family protein [Pseudomonadales bacterium]MCP5330340.1 YggU family protein [Pseudomonadales bacterium]MCP5344047.1 YggU family protein [Pseudomonadales bacterium]